MKKEYKGIVMIKHSRFIHYLETRDEEFNNKVADKIDKYLSENKEYLDKGNYIHLTNIFTSMSLYYTLKEEGKSEEEAIDITFNTMYKFMEAQRDKFQKLATKGWFWTLIKKIVPIGFKKGSGYGWRYTWYKKGMPKNEFKFECNECIYQKIFKKYDLVDFGPRFCYNDVIVYGNLPRTDFIRTKTLCRGGDFCDFKFVRYKKDEEFKRTESV